MKDLSSIKDFMKNLWVKIKEFFTTLFKDSNRSKHFLYAIPIGFVFTILCVLGVASGMEFKDKCWGGKWDWLDWTATMIGGLVGQGVQLLFYFIFFK